MKYKLSITLVKGLISLAMVICAGLISIWQNDTNYMFLIPVIEMLLNWLKHRKD